ncbi:hypothetical protein PFZ55_19045 [Streptomyces sp. MS2A]|nr:hypothetical protein [Streptomyces sp. MS2A]
MPGPGDLRAGPPHSECSLAAGRPAGEGRSRRALRVRRGQAGDAGGAHPAGAGQARRGAPGAAGGAASDAGRLTGPSGVRLTSR